MNLEEFKYLFDSLYPSLCLFANKYLNDMDTSKDLVQEVFIKIWQKNAHFKNHNAVKAYFYKTVKNRCLDFLKSKRFKVLNNSIPIDLVEIETEDFFLVQMATAEIYSYLYKAIDKLPKKTAKVIQLTLNNYTTNEIAEELAVAPSTVRTQKTEAYHKLRKILGNINQLFCL